MSSITRPGVVAAPAGCAGLGADGGAVARAARQDAPHLPVSDRAGIELAVEVFDAARDDRRAVVREPDAIVSGG